MTFTFATSRDAFDYWTLAGNLLLVVVGIVGIIVAVWNVKQARISAEAARTAAEAANVAAEAAVKSIKFESEVQRPRITIRAEGTSLFTFTMVNKGATPAEIVWFNNVPRWHFPLIGDKMPEPHFGAFHDQDDWRIMNVPILHPSEEMEAGTFWLQGIEEGNPELFREIKEGKRFLYLYSSIKYKGALNDQIFETRYCYRLTSNGLLMAGDFGYNFEN